MQETKSVFSSITFWGSVMSLLGALTPQLFVYLGADPATSATYVVSAIGFAIAVYGRFKATKAVTLTGAPKS